MIASSKTFVENYKNWLQFSALKQFNKCQCQNYLHPGAGHQPVIGSHDHIEFVSCFSQLFSESERIESTRRLIINLARTQFYFPDKAGADPFPGARCLNPLPQPPGQPGAPERHHHQRNNES